MYIINPARKFRFLSNVVIKSSSRLLKQPTCAPCPSPSNVTNLYVPDTRPRRVVRRNLSEKALPEIPLDELQRDAHYYSNDMDSGCCVFRAENTLFKVRLVWRRAVMPVLIDLRLQVHKCYLMREPCAFGDLFSLPSVPGAQVEGLTDDAPVPLSDSAEEFRGLLWGLYALSVVHAQGPMFSAS